MSDIKTLNSIFKTMISLMSGKPNDWDRNKTVYLMVLEADHNGTAFLGLSDEKQTEVINKVQNIVKGDETI